MIISRYAENAFNKTQHSFIIKISVNDRGEIPKFDEEYLQNSYS